MELEYCVSCREKAPSRRFRLHRFQHYGAAIGVTITKDGEVWLCDECYAYFDRANQYRFAGFGIVIASLLLGAALIYVIGLASLLLGVIGIAAGVFLVHKGRRRVAALERRVGF